MRTKDIQIEKLPKTNIRSKVRFKGIFNEEIQKTIENLGDFLDKNLEKNYEVDYVDIGSRNIKIKITDEEKFIFRTINCIFDHTSVDVKYGNCRIELVFTELSKSPRHHLVGKFNLLERDKINSEVLKYAIKGIEEIYE